MVYVGHNNKVYGINAKDGAITWSYGLPLSAIANQFDESSPCFNNGVIYVNCVNSAEEGLIGVNALTGDLVLQYRHLFYSATVVSPCAYNNGIYTAFTNDSGEGFIIQYNLDNPNVPSGYQILTTGTSSPTIFNSTLYIGSSDYLYSYAESASGGPARWRFQASSTVSSSSPTADSNKVYIGSENGTLYAINDSNGIKQWEYKTLNNGVNLGASTSPTLANGVIYYGATNGLYAVNAETGKLIWNNFDGGGIFSSPCVIDKSGKVYHSNISGIMN